MEREIVVLGRGIARGLPDRGLVSVTLDADGPTQAEAYAAAAKIATEVDAAFAAAGDAIDRVVTSSLIVQPTTRWKKGETIRTGWRASRRSTLEVTALDRLGEILAGVANAGGAISGLEWQLDPGHAAPSTARAEAAADARRRAEDYAGALGVSIEGVAWVSEPGLRIAGSGSGGMGLPMRAMMARGADPESDVIAVEIEEITVEAEVEVGFTIAG